MMPKTREETDILNGVTLTFPSAVLAGYHLVLSRGSESMACKFQLDCKINSPSNDLIWDSAITFRMRESFYTLVPCLRVAFSLLAKYRRVQRWQSAVRCMLFCKSTFFSLTP